MGFKDFWIVSDKDKNKDATDSKQAQVTEPTTFPTSQTFPTAQAAPVAQAAPAPTIGATNCEPHMDAIMDMYEKGFDGLNRDGVEFFEFFKAVAAANFEPGAYKMALSVLSGMEKNMTKESLIEQSAYYINEIQLVHTRYTQNGNNKKAEIERSKATENEQLKNDLLLLEEQLKTISAQIESKKIALNQIDTKYAPAIEEVMCKIAANDTAKDRIVGTINMVVQGIKTNI
jgi:hypothetical protein